MWRVQGKMKREINLKPEEVKAILIQAKLTSERDFLLLKTMTLGDFRSGEVVGSAARRWDPQSYEEIVDKKGNARQVGRDFHWVPAEPNLPGLLIEDLRDDGVWVQGKGWKKDKNPTPPKKVQLPADLVAELRLFVGKREKGRIFEISWSRVWQMLHLYAKRAGVIDWKLVHPHRLRHYMTTQVARKHGVIAARDIARHKNIRTTNRYIAELAEDEKRAIIGELAGILE